MEPGLPSGPREPPRNETSGWAATSQKPVLRGWASRSRALLAGPHGFNELARAVGGVTTTLAARLERLRREGIVAKTIESTMPLRTRYALTPVGVALQGVIAAIDRWARAHLQRCRASACDPAAAPTDAAQRGV